MNYFRFQVYGDPRPWARARRGKQGHFFVKPEETAYRERIRTAARFLRCPFFVGPVSMDLDVYLDGRIEYWKRGSGDRDNYLKLVGDALEGIAYANDACIVDGLPRKLPAGEGKPRIEITLRGEVGVPAQKRRRGKVIAMASYSKGKK